MMENQLNEPQIIVELRPINVKIPEKSSSVTLVKRYNYKGKNRVEKQTVFLKELLTHRIDKSPRIRPFTI
jgi:hypothetical protein